ncbi:pentatricopeptide repeat-containing protein MRL1, chloroplastic isoform X2 [Hevea brasiliensis]|uniref:pentatricopeptide repeat-containing protein MRL1, chloroplastic isoform X2 n=1 Tax=Hevea brasiliensis TaxID=3981 RepID=UPI0025E35E6E|nr:pentatricopeptide repeat-containing protein MRL1, chloroplastic isoform X2 [Hevea brasiliensis]
MELCFSAKSHSLTPVSGAQISTKSSIRKEFLGCSHNLRPPGGPIRGSKCSKLRIRRTQSQSFLINASFGSDSVLVVVAVSTLSALSFAYLNQHLTNRNSYKKSSKEDLGSPSVGLSHLRRNIVNIVGRPFLDVGDSHRGTLAAQSKDLAGSNKENGYAIEGKETHVQVLEDTVTSYSSLLVQTTESSNADFSVSSGSTYVVPKEPEPPLSSIPESGSIKPLVFARGMSKLTLQKSNNEIDGDSAFPQVMTEQSDTTSPSVYSQAGKNVDLTSYYGISEESDREDLYTFYEENKSVVKSPLNLNGSRTVCSRASSPIGNSFSSLKVNAIVKEVELSLQHSPQIAESVERKVRLAPYERVSSRKNENTGRRGFPRDKEKGHLIQDNHKKLPDFPYPNVIHATDKDHPPEQVHAYNRLLRDGRLAECVDLLEDMERRGLLDMSKIYHAKFFKICKIQKAVKEAFRFCKLVPNPTLSTFNMLMSVCASSQDSKGAFEVLQLAQGAGLKADCRLYTTLISTCAKSGKVDAMFEVFHEMVNAGVEPNVHTYGTLIDGCGRAGQMAKAFGAYGIMRSKKVKPDRVVFNALITACGQSGAVDRAFDVLAEMRAETQPIDPDHITVGALINACAKAGQVDRAKEVYNMMHEFDIKGTPEVYTIAVDSCSQTGDWEFARSVYDDMKRKGVAPDEMFLSALIDVAGHAGMVDVAFDILREAKIQGSQLGIIPYSSLMGACSNGKNWQKALELYDDMKSIKLNPTVSTMNALITALCAGDQLPKAIEVLSEMKSFGLCPNTVTYSILLVASERKDDLEVGQMLLSQTKEDCVAPTLVMCKCIIGMCLRRYEKACALGQNVLPFDSGRRQIKNKWTSMALMVYRETIAAGEKPTMDVVSQILGCLKLPSDASLKTRLVENLGVTADSSKYSNLCSLLDGFGEYDPCAFSLLEEAASLGIIPCVSWKASPIVIDAKTLQIHVAEVYLLNILKGLKHRLAAGLARRLHLY